MVTTGEKYSWNGKLSLNGYNSAYMTLGGTSGRYLRIYNANGTLLGGIELNSY